jgi:hypothetical protein
MIKIIILLVVLSTNIQAQITGLINASFDQVWRAAIEVFSERTQIQTIDKNSGFIQTTEQVLVRGLGTMVEMNKWAIAPKGVLQVYDMGLVTSSAFIRKKNANQTEAQIKCRYRTASHGLMGGNSLEWPSRGITEQEVIAAIKGTLQKNRATLTTRHSIYDKCHISVRCYRFHLNAMREQFQQSHNQHVTLLR